MRILVADDHPAVRRCVCGVLGAEGWMVCGEASNGREAVELALQLKPDVIVLDISMPELNGLEAAQQVLKNLPGSNVVILTMHQAEALTQTVLAMGVRACVLKTDLQCLVRAVRSLCRRGRRRAARAGNCERESPETGDKEDVELSITRLTDLERDILHLLARSKTNREIAIALSISVETVQVCRSRIMEKLGTDSIVDCVRFALRNTV